jgi:molecular chaperone GrpE
MSERRLRELARNPKRKRSEEPGEEGSEEQPDEIQPEIGSEAPEEMPRGDDGGTEAGRKSGSEHRGETREPQPALQDAGKPQRESVEPVKQSLDEMTRLAAQYLDRLKYLQAEFDNYKKWVERDRLEFTKVANQKLVLAVLPAIDNLEKAIEAGGKDKTPFAEGIRLIYAELMESLAAIGLRAIKAAGTKFDPYMHEALLAEHRSGVEDGVIIEELQKGYTLNDKVIRTSKVKIAKKPDPDLDTEAIAEPDEKNGRSGGAGNGGSQPG